MSLRCPVLRPVLPCTVKAGGKLTVRAKDVKMTPGFKVEKGGIFITKTKQ